MQSNITAVLGPTNTGKTHYAITQMLAQITGRAGRFTTDGIFGVTGEAAPLEPQWVETIENHRFAPLENR